MRGGECAFLDNARDNPADVTITVASGDWADVMSARRNVSALMRSGRMKVTGNMSLFASMKRIFSLGEDRRVGGV